MLKKCAYTVFVKNVNAIDTSGLVKKADYNNKITAIEGETPDMTSLATATAVNDVKNIANVSDIAKKTNYDPKISDVEILLHLIMINLRMK